jgi:hypothetical protein
MYLFFRNHFPGELLVRSPVLYSGVIRQNANAPMARTMRAAFAFTKNSPASARQQHFDQ